MNHKEHCAIELPANRDRFLAWAASEDDGFVSVGGLAVRCGLYQSSCGGETDRARVFGHFIELARRKAGLSLEALAERADVDLSELVAVERDNASPEPRTVFQLSNALDLPLRGLQELAGFFEVRSQRLNQAALRFAARSEPTAQLTPDEREALDEFVKALAESTD